MTRKPPKTPKDTPEAQYKRFLETAKEVEASDDPKALDRVIKGITPRQKAKR